MTNAEFVSRVVNGLNSLNKDEHISKRYILKIGQNKSKFYISQKLLDKSLFRETNLFRTIDCLRLDEEETIKCGIHEFTRCDSLMKSRKKIPGLIYNRLGSSIISITSLNGDVVFEAISPKGYANSRDRPLVKKLGIQYFYIKNDYLYLPDSTVEYVTVTFIPFSEAGIKATSECDGEGVDDCGSVWDEEFMVPDKMSEQVIRETIQEVSMKKQIPEDQNPNMNSNQK